MSVQIVLDVTNEYLTGSESGTPYLVKLDVGGYDYAVVQFVNPGDPIYFLHSNDSGGIQGVSDGSAVSSINYLPLQGINLSDGSLANVTTNSTIFRFDSIARYLALDGTPDSSDVGKILVRLYKIH